VVDEFLGGAAAHHHRQAVLQLRLRDQVAVVGGELLGDAERADAARRSRSRFPGRPEDASERPPQ
jgi:hypothetical protein